MTYINISKQTLIQEYLQNKKSTRQIAKILNCNYNTIRSNLKKYNLPIRTKSESIKIRKPKKIHYCVDCNKQISFTTWKYGTKRCKSCAAKNKNHSNNCLCAMCKREEYRKKVNNLGKNNPNWKGGRPYCVDCGKELWNYTNKRCKKCYLNIIKGKNNPNYKDGRCLEKDPKCIDCNKTISISTAIYGNKRCKKCAYKFFSGKNNTNWQGGKSFEPYSSEFNKLLKLRIRERDNFICQGKDCGITEEESKLHYNKVLAIHHIDYNKYNCKETNLITLCNKCNSKANSNRDYWKNYYKNLIKVDVLGSLI